MGYSTGLELAEIPQQRPRCAHGFRLGVAQTQAIDRSQGKAAGQLRPGELGIEFPALARGTHDLHLELELCVQREHQLGGLEPGERFA